MIERDGRLDVFREQRDQRLRQRIAKDEFRPNDQDLATAHQNKKKVSAHRFTKNTFSKGKMQAAAGAGEHIPSASGP